MASHFPQGHIERQWVDLRDTIRRQRDALRTTLQSVLDYLKQEELSHRHQFRNHKLSDEFHSSTTYMLSKIQAGTRGSEKGFGEAALLSIISAIDFFRKALDERGRLADAALFTIDDEISYCISRLRMFYSENRGPTIDGRDAYMFAHFLEDKVEFLRKIAQETDEEYSSDDLPD